MSYQTASITDIKELTPVERWSEEIDMSEKELKTFHSRAKRVVRRFLDERDTMEASAKWFNIFYANTNILESALYAQLPKPSVTRRFKDYNDDVARVAGLILQRAITQDLDDPRDTFDSTMRQCVQDRLVPGVATAWLRLETDTETIDDVLPAPEPDMETEEVGETSNEDTAINAGAEAEPLKKITDQRVVIDYIFWGDFLWSPCRIWEERRWVGRKVYMTRKELIKRFGEDKGKTCPLDYRPNPINTEAQESTPKHEALQKAVVYELWERSTRKVVWYAKGMTELLDEVDDPLKLVGFEPCPIPMLANLSTSNTTPRPDYYMIQDQYQELDTVNNRISMLVQACKVVGVYDKAAIGVQRMLTEGFDNQLIPVDNWAMFAEKGGLKGQIDWLPLESVVMALTNLNAAREAIKGQIYELTGIADIVRGASKASETLGAQQIKAQFASVRIKKLQDEVARFASDLLRVKAEIMVKHFTPEILIQKSNIMATGNDEFVGPAMQLLASDEGFEWRIQVTADSIAQADYAMEKADRLEFLTAVSSYLEKAGMMFQAVPGSATLLIGMLKWAVSGFRNAAEIEGMIDKELDAITKAPPPAPKPDPAAQKAQADIQVAQQKAQIDMQSKQADMAMKERLGQMELQMKAMELKFKEQELNLEAQKMQMEMNFAGAEAAQKQRTSIIEQEMALKSQAQQHEQSSQFAQQDHAMKLKQAKEQPKPTNGAKQ